MRFLGETADLVPLYQAADGFLHPTLYDACANTVLQSLACGLPGLISSRDGASEFIRDGENGFLLNDPTDCGQVLEGVRKLANLGSLAETVRASARKTALPLTWETHLQAWLQVIADLRK